jgi:dCMP deaminase
MDSTRPTWDETWMNVAEVIKLRARCSRAQVGAVIVDVTNRIVATGYNGPPAGWRGMIAHMHPDDIPSDWYDNCVHWCQRSREGPTPETIRSYEDCPMIHAETNALSFCDRRHREGGTMYVTSPTCVACAKGVANSGLARVVMRNDGDRKYRVGDGINGVEFMRGCGLTVKVV